MGDRFRRSANVIVSTGTNCHCAALWDLRNERHQCPQLQIAHREAPGLGLDAGFCRRYLGNIIHFDLGPREQAGLHHFYMLACQLGLARRGVPLEYYGQTHLAESR